jgi:hypothetical protein
METWMFKPTKLIDALVQSHHAAQPTIEANSHKGIRNPKKFDALFRALVQTHSYVAWSLLHLERLTEPYHRWQVAFDYVWLLRSGNLTHGDIIEFERIARGMGLDQFFRAINRESSYPDGTSEEIIGTMRSIYNPETLTACR